MEVQAFTSSGTFIPATTATGSSQYSTYAATNVIDGSTSTMFYSNSGSLQWVQIDLGSNTSIGKVVIVNRQDAGQARTVGCAVKLINASNTTLYTSPQLDTPQNVFSIVFSTPSPSTTFTIADHNGQSVWLDATSSGAWFSSAWINYALYKSGNAGVFGGTWTAANWVADILNGMPAIQFSGTNSLSIADAAGLYSAGFTLFVVFKPTASNTYKTLLARGNSYLPGPFDIYNNVRFIGNGTGTGKNFTRSTVNLNTLTLNRTYVFCFRVSATGTTAKLSEWLDGTLKYKDTTLSYYSDIGTSLYIGSRSGFDTSYTGYMGEIIMYKSAITDTEVDNMNTYLSQKWKPLPLWYKFESGNLSGTSVTNFGTLGVGIVSTGATISTTSYFVGTGSLSLTSSYMTIPDPGFTTRGLTITAWFKYPSTTNGWTRLFEFGNGKDSNNFGYAPKNGLFVYQGSTAMWANGVGGGFADNAWHHVGITLTYAPSGSATSTINIYIDGVVKYTTTTGYYPLILPRTQCYIGKSSWPTDPNATGNVDDFRFYNCAMTAEDVIAIYTG